MNENDLCQYPECGHWRRDHPAGMCVVVSNLMGYCICPGFQEAKNEGSKAL